MQNFVANKTLKRFPEKKHLHCKRQEDLVLGDDSEHHDLRFYLKVKGREVWNFSASVTIQLIHFPEVIFLASPAVFPLKTIRGLLLYLAEGAPRDSNHIFLKERGFFQPPKNPSKSFAATPPPHVGIWDAWLFKASQPHVLLHRPSEQQSQRPATWVAIVGFDVFWGPKIDGLCWCQEVGKVKRDISDKIR